MSGNIKRIANKAFGFEEAAKWDIEQQINMTPDERFTVANELKELVYGKDCPDVREWHRSQGMIKEFSLKKQYTKMSS